MRRTGRALSALLFALVSCTSRAATDQPPVVNDQPLRIYASAPLLPLTYQLVNQYAVVNPGVTFDVIGGSYESVYEQANANRTSYFFTEHLPPHPLWAAPIGQDGIAVIVNPENPIHTLTSEQVRDIYRGLITNWRDLGGADQAISVITREDGSGTRAEFEQLVIGERDTTRLARIAPSGEAMIDAVGRDRAAIGYVSFSLLEPRVRAVTLDNAYPTAAAISENRYPLRSILYIAGFSEPEAHYRAFIFWVQSPEGQRFVARQFAPLVAPGAG